MPKINVPGDSYRDYKELIVPEPLSLKQRLRLWWIGFDGIDTFFVTAIIVFPILFLSAVIYKEVMISRLNKAAIHYLERVPYTNISIVNSDNKYYTAGTGCLGMNREISAKANYIDGRSAEVLLCCNSDTFSCVIEKTFFEKP